MHCIPFSKAHVESEELLDFLRDTVAGAPDLPPAGEDVAKPKPKRQRWVGWWVGWVGLGWVA